MKDKPVRVKVESRDVVFGEHDGEEIGKETGHAHKLLCRLRRAGATRKDLVKMRDADPFIFAEFIARVRGVQPSDNQDDDLRLINLDYEPGSQESLSKLSGGGIDKGSSLVSDNRLGIWPVNEENGLVFGDMRFNVGQPAGYCAKKSTYCVAKLSNIPGQCEHLNLAMASWFSRGGRIDIPFDDPSLFDKKLGNKSIFFLGTVWYEHRSGCFWAPALVSGKNDRIELRIRQVPDGEWPKDCYVAILVPI